MCGIFGGFKLNNFDSDFNILSKKLIIDFILLASQRGKDGYSIYSDSFKSFSNIEVIKNINKPTLKDLNEFTFNNNNDYLIGNCRAKPETEVDTSLKNMQPISNTFKDIKFILAHNGAISESLVNYVKQKNQTYKFKTNIDSESLALYILNDNNLLNKSLENIDGGFAFSLYYKKQNKFNIILATKYHPLYIMECFIKKDNKIYKFLYYHSCSGMKNIVLDFLNENEYDIINYNFYQMKEFTFKHFKIDNNKTLKIENSFIPKFYYPKSIHNVTQKNKILVACSGGIDSTCTLIMSHLLFSKYKNFDIEAIHFKYGHRGEEAEVNAINNIVKKINQKIKKKINLKIIDVSFLYSNIFNVNNSQLIDKNSKIETGTQEGLKSTVAWVPIRNMLFSVIMAGIAETNILENNYKDVYLCAGWNQLSEEGFYPDNSQLFTEAFHQLCNFGTLTGKHIKSLTIARNILKSDQWVLADFFNFLDIYKYTISCDIPQYDKNTNTYYNCDNQCGSTMLSTWAVKRWNNIKDPRTFIHCKNKIISEKEQYKLPDKINSRDYTIKDVLNILNSIELPIKINFNEDNIKQYQL